MKTAIKWVAILCILAWASKNPAQVGADVHALFGAFFHGGPEMVLGGLIVVWALSRILACASVLFLGRSKKGEQ